MDELFALVIALTFLLSLIISSLVLLLVWIAIPEINNHKALVVVIILGLSASLTLHYSKQEYNPNKYYKTLAERYHDFKTSRSQGK